MSGKKNWAQKINSYILGNRRLRAYIFAMIKFTAVTMIQGYESFPKDEDAFYKYNDVFITLGYCWIGILATLFTERYIREVVCNNTKQGMAIWLNWVEMVIFTVYTVYGTFCSILHWVAIGMKSDYLGPLKTVIYVFNQLVIQLCIWEKWTHFLHSGHSVSLYIETEQHIPPHEHEHHDDHDEHDEHGHGHDDHHGGHGEHGHGHDDHHDNHGHDDHGKHGHNDHGHEEHKPLKDEHGHGHGTKDPVLIDSHGHH